MRTRLIRFLLADIAALLDVHLLSSSAATSDLLPGQTHKETAPVVTFVHLKSIVNPIVEETVSSASD